MGFCRRCGDIVSGERCKCGGIAVAPVVSWKEHGTENQDKWSKTYVLRDRSVSSVNNSSIKQHSKDIPISPSKNSSTSTAATAVLGPDPRTVVPLKPTKTGPVPEAGILLSPCDSTLAKVYGSVLQSTESLATFSCVICNSVFPPDATIYPDPLSSDAAGENRFLCRPCFIANGGSKGTCPTCSRPVLTLKSDGGFIHAADKYWHKRCFNCDGCHKNIGDAPMVDILGRPSCPDCFDSCLRRGRGFEREESAPVKKPHPTPIFRKNLGGMDSSSPLTVPGQGLKSREASPGLEELEQRLGIAKNTREGSPSLEELSQRLSSIGKESPRPRRDSRHSERFKSPEPEDFFSSTGSPERASAARSTPLSTPVRNHTTGTGSPAPTPEAIEEMKSRFMRSSSISSPTPASSPLNHLAQSFTTSSPSQVSRSSTQARMSISSRLPIPSSQSQPQPHTNSLDSPYSLSPSTSKIPALISDLSNLSPPSNSGSPTRSNTTLYRNDGELERVDIDFRVQASRLPASIDVTDVIIEETESQMTTPIHTPNKKAEAKATPPSRIPVASRSPNTKVTTTTTFAFSTNLENNRLTASERCAKCGGLLFSRKEGGKYLTLPAEEGAKAKIYHVECFRCTVCDNTFKESGKGQAVFVKAQGGPCHVECAPPVKHTIPKSTSMSKLQFNNGQNTAATSNAALDAPESNHSTLSSSGSGSPGTSTPHSSSRYERPSTTVHTPANLGIPRFGSRTTCPGCNMPVSPMERGVVPGPQGTRWHAACLVCGGKKAKDVVTQQKSDTWMIGRAGGTGLNERQKKAEPGCGKRLDSAAKTDGEGGVWCRECSLMLVSSPSTTKPLISPAMGAAAKGLIAQNTGTTLARQFTGLGAGAGDPGKESGILRQLTGGSLSPTRSISPTKQLNGGSPSWPTTSGRPRPRSVIGMRNSKSIDEGRGMFLVRQMTGNGSMTQSSWGAR